MKRERLVEIIKEVESFPGYINYDVAVDLILDEIEKSKTPQPNGTEASRGVLPASHPFKSPRPTPPLSPDSTGPAEETEEELDERIARMGARENMRLIDSISDLIGLPHNVELELHHVRSALTPSAPIAAPVRDDGHTAAAIANCIEAVAFFDQVKAASEAEKTAVGRDHWNWLESACRRVASLPAPAGDVPGEAQTKLST